MSQEALKRNGHNLELGAFDRAGEYGIPVLQPVQLDQRLEWVRFNHALRETHRDQYGVQFFIDDYLFQRAWHDPPRYALFLRQFPAVDAQQSGRHHREGTEGAFSFKCRIY